jgi:hypothetical protein
MVRTKIKPFLKRKKVPKFYFHFGQQKKCPIRRPILHFFNSHVNTTKIIFSTGRKLVAYSWLVSYSLFITYSYSLFLISFDGFQLNLENTSTTENASSLLIFKFRGQGHGDILSFHI